MTAITDRDKDKQELLKVALGQAESELRTLQTVDSAFKIMAYQAAGLSLPVAFAAPLPWLFVGPVLDFYNSLPVPWLPSIAKPDFWQTLFLMAFTFFAAFLACFQHFFRIRIDNWDAMTWRWESRFNQDIDGDGVIGEPPPKAERIDRLARIILERHYLDKKDASRDACEDAHVCSQREWNAVNLVLKKLGIKGDRGFLIPDYGRAFEIYRRRVSIYDDAMIVTHEHDQGFERLKFDEDK